MEIINDLFSYQNKEISLSPRVRHENFKISLYFDFLSFIFNNSFKYPANKILSLMINLALVFVGYITMNNLGKSITNQE